MKKKSEEAPYCAFNYINFLLHMLGSFVLIKTCEDAEYLSKQQLTYISYYVNAF